MLRRLHDDLARMGMMVRGGFHPTPDDRVPPLPDGHETATVVLIGNAGGALWRAFTASKPDLSRRNPLEAWMRPGIEGAAVAVDAHALFPNDGPPYPPVQHWAARAEPVYRSPTGIMIHPDYGLWHAWRAALLFAETVALPMPDRRPNPCVGCARKPCVAVCPADAFRPHQFVAADCVAHVEGPAGVSCRDGGCMARRACPVGREHAYPPEAQRFHTAAFLRATKAGFADAAAQGKCAAP